MDRCTVSIAVGVSIPVNPDVNANPNDNSNHNSDSICLSVTLSHSTVSQTKFDQTLLEPFTNSKITLFLVWKIFTMQ